MRHDGAQRQAPQPRPPEQLGEAQPLVVAHRRVAHADEPDDAPQVARAGPAARRRQGYHRQGPPAAPELDGDPAAQRVADQVRCTDPQGVEGGFDPVGEGGDTDRRPRVEDRPAVMAR